MTAREIRAAAAKVARTWDHICGENIARRIEAIPEEQEGQEEDRGGPSKKKEASMKRLKYVIVRTYSAGVFAGLLESRKGQEVVLRQARRIWHWEGAASLSELAQRGTSMPTKCKFPCEVDRIEVLQVIEILDVTPEARASIAAVPVWTA